MKLTKFVKVSNFLLIMVVSIVLNNFLYTMQVAPMQVGVNAEWDLPQVILMHTPGDEIFYGLLHANAALFEAPFDGYAAQREHQNYISTLQKNGIKVVQIVDVLLMGTLNEDGSKREGRELDELIEFADRSLTYYMPTGWPQETFIAQVKYKQETLRNLHPRNLVRIILERPSIHLRDSSEHNTKFIAQPYESSPLMNMHFLRDQQITTAKGIVLGRMNSTQRENEVNIMSFVFHKLGINPIYRVSGQGRLEWRRLYSCR